MRNFLASILGSLVAFGIVFAMFLIFLSLAGAEEVIVVRKDSVLELNTPYPIKDYTGLSETDVFAGFFNRSQGLDEILQAISVAKEDDDILGISINGNFLMAGIAQTQAIRRALLDFKSGGKFVYAYGDVFLQKDYYLSSVADSIFLNPSGVIDFKGLSAEVLYFEDLQKKSGIRMEVVRHGDYKNAVEPFLTNEMSNENRSQIQSLINSIWSTLASEIAESRGKKESELNQIADTLGGRSPQLALQSGLVDGLLYQDEYELRLKSKIGRGADKDLNIISLTDYTKVARGRKVSSGSERIAVIYAQGEMIYGEGGADFIGQGLLVDAIRRATEDDRVKAIVLRVDSPGGNALTADIIWRELQLANEKKPLIVSMGNMATSAGYYIALAGDQIFAEPTSITGSIGVFVTVPNVSGLADNVGINAEQVGTHSNSVDYSLFEPMSESFRLTLKEGIEETYNTFLSRVSDSRSISMTRADSLAQGRVWSGIEAVELGLVDAVGGLDTAIEAAAEAAGLESYRLKKYPRYKTDFERFMEGVSSTGDAVGESYIKGQLGEEASHILNQLRSVFQQEGIQARLPYILNIR